jgi:hypothetical protein
MSGRLAEEATSRAHPLPNLLKRLEANSLRLRTSKLKYALPSNTRCCLKQSRYHEMFRTYLLPLKQVKYRDIEKTMSRNHWKDCYQRDEATGSTIGR